MAETLKLDYFPLRGRAEIIRILLHAAKVPFEDNIISFDDWPKLKPGTPFGSLPVTTIKGKQYSQSLALASYFAREYGYYGKDNLEGLQIDLVQQLREDLMIIETKRFVAKMHGKKEEEDAMIKDLKETTWPRFLGFFNKIIKENGTGFAVGDKLSLADIVIFEGTQTIVLEKPELLDDYPEVKAVREKVLAVPSVKTYIESKPVLPF